MILLISSIVESIPSNRTVNGSLLFLFDEVDDFSITLYAYKCKLISGDLTLSEHTDAKWALVDEMKNMDFAEADNPLIELLK